MMPASSPAPRFNPWPYAIIAFFGVAIAGTATLVFIATSNRTELVAADYYDQEIRFQKRLDQVRRTQVWESQIAVGFDAPSATVRVTLPAEHAALAAKGRVEFYRPAFAGADRSLPLALDARGGQSIPAAGLSPGRWKVRLQWTVGADDFFVERDLVMPAG